MHHPGTAWTVACALSLVAWCGYSTWRMRRIFAPAHAADAAAEAAMEAYARSTTHDERVQCMAALADAMTPQYVALARARQWTDHIHMPVVVTLGVPTVVLAVWGVL